MSKCRESIPNVPSGRGIKDSEVPPTNLPGQQSNWGNFETCTNPRMCEFSIQNRQNISTVWVPSEPAAATPPRIIQPTQIFYTHIGMVPHFTGFVPGYQFKCGGTYGALTKNPLGR